MKRIEYIRKRTTEEIAMDIIDLAVTDAYCNDDCGDEDCQHELECRVCGCTWDNACPGGCYWVEPDLCSRCVGKE